MPVDLSSTSVSHSAWAGSRNESVNDVDTKVIAPKHGVCRYPATEHLTSIHFVAYGARKHTKAAGKTAKKHQVNMHVGAPLCMHRQCHPAPKHEVTPDRQTLAQHGMTRPRRWRGAHMDISRGRHSTQACLCTATFPLIHPVPKTE